jgi:hypothetical protein
MSFTFDEDFEFLNSCQKLIQSDVINNKEELIDGKYLYNTENEINFLTNKIDEIEVLNCINILIFYIYFYILFQVDRVQGQYYKVIRRFKELFCET